MKIRNTGKNKNKDKNINMKIQLYNNIKIKKGLEGLKN